MKGLLIFLTVAVVAVSAVNLAVPARKNIINNAEDIVQCIKDTAVVIEANVVKFVAAWNEVASVIAANVAKIEACIGLNDPLAIVGCVTGVYEQYKVEVTEAVTAAEATYQELVASLGLIAECL